MNTVYPNKRAVYAAIERLMQEPYFLDGTLSMYADVPIKCLQYEPAYCDEIDNLCSAPDKYRYDAFDFLVCRGNTAIACIDFSGNRDIPRLNELLGGYLRGLDCIAHSAAKLEDEDLDAFCQSAALRLCEYAHADFYCTKYSLVPRRFTVGLQALTRNCLLENDGDAASFRRDCGIFFGCYTEEDGTLFTEPLTCPKTFQEQENALSWQSEANEDTAELQRILDMPLAEFCRSNIDCFTEFQILLNAFAGPLEGFPALTFQDTCRSFLSACSDCDGNPLPQFSRKAIFIVLERLRRILAKVIRDGDLPFFQIPLYRYYTAAANLSGCYYPLWLYRNRVRPHLCNHPEDFFTMSEYAGYANAHLTNLMVAPICVPGMCSDRN